MLEVSEKHLFSENDGVKRLWVFAILRTEEG
jgi:hypothetical protein